MPNIRARIDYLQKLKLYESEKPFYMLLAPQEGFDPDEKRLDNLEYEAHENILIRDIREAEDKLNLAENGFQVLSHTSNFLDLNSRESVEAYGRETEELLKEQLGAVHVKCYEVRKRENVPMSRKQMDYYDPLLIEGPAKGAHNDVTYSSGPKIIDRHLSPEEKGQYLRPGYRFRIINTWRSLIPDLEDRPLALCDSRSVAPRDLVAADRIIPDRVGEVYYLSYNPEHRWWFLEHQTPDEPFMMIMYDTKAAPGLARFCPHVSFDNVRKGVDAAPRRSVETRSVVVTQE